MKHRRPATRHQGAIVIVGAREHNLKNISLEIPHGQFVVVTGVSGSGKSTLAFDLLFAEGQRRFLDSLNAYARQFVEQLARPEVDMIAGIPPTVSIEQRNSRGGGKSTVATVTEVHHFLRLLFTRVGTVCCPDCELPVTSQTRDEIRRRLGAEARRRGELTLLSPVIRNRKGFHTEVAEWAGRHGFDRIRADGKILPAADRLRLDRFREHNVEVVTGIVPSRSTQASLNALIRLVDRSLEVGKGTLFALDAAGKVTVHSTSQTCTECGQSFEALDPKNFSYNSPRGWCPTCRGFGELFYLPEVERGARADAVEESWYGWQEGKREPCPECGGARLNRFARAVRLDMVGAKEKAALECLAPPKASGSKSMPPGLSMDMLAHASVETVHQFFRRYQPRGRVGEITRDILPEITDRLRFLREVGLGYLQLGRGVPTLSGGEAQRIRLAAQLGSNLTGVLYILDEPTIGLHAHDNEQLLKALASLRERGNSLLVVEHDEATMRYADTVIDLGPGAGAQGGEVVACGTLEELARHPESITGRCLREQTTYPVRGSRRPVSSQAPHLELKQASLHNLKNVTLRIPLGRLVLVTGVSGSGKSTIIRECLAPTLKRQMQRGKRARSTAGGLSALGTISAGAECFRAVHEVDQSPIGRTPRSIPATYVGFFDDIRRLFAQLPESRMRGYTPGRFSFNSAQGRCPECEGAGSIKLEMNFLPPAYVRCESCRGERFSPETLEIEFNGKTIAQVLEMTVAEAGVFFAAQPRIRRPLEGLEETGLGYLHLGQTSPTLSGGEAQRVKLVSHLLSGLKSKEERVPGAIKGDLFLLEEPSVGLHMADVRQLVDVLHRLVDAGNTVVVIEHNLDLIAEADWVIDLGPQGGEQGGRIIAEGTPEEVARTRGSLTGKYLKPLLRRPK